MGKSKMVVERRVEPLVVGKNQKGDFGMNIREIEHDRRLENLKTALKEYVDYVEYIKRANAAPNKRKPSKGIANTGRQVRRDEKQEN